MLRIGLCDDIADARLLLEDALERALEINGWEAQFFQFSSGEGLLDWYAKHLGELDLVFLDMEMKTLSGIDTAKRLRALDDSLQLAFCTSYSDRRLRHRRARIPAQTAASGAARGSAAACAGGAIARA